MSHTDLGGPILKAVSRSFYLSIRVLPRAVRAPIGLAYLLARASDTIADSTEAATDTRLSHLAAFGRMIQTGEPAGLTELVRDIQPKHQGERALVERLGQCLAWLHSLSEFDQSAIRAVLEKIIRGQTLDLQRFHVASTASQLRALQTAAELEEYTYLVAGCVGEFWTDVCLHHLPGYARLAPEEIRRVGIDFGKGLQLVNILRDLPSDLREGRCYLPVESLSAAGLSPEDLLARPESARGVFLVWLGRANELLDGGRRYITGIRPARIRIACYLPWYLGVATLDLLQERPPLEAEGRIKVPRSTVRAALLRASVVAWCDCCLTARAPALARP